MKIALSQCTRQLSASRHAPEQRVAQTECEQNSIFQTTSWLNIESCGPLPVGANRQKMEGGGESRELTHGVYTLNDTERALETQVKNCRV